MQVLFNALEPERMEQDLTPEVSQAPKYVESGLV